MPTAAQYLGWADKLAVSSEDAVAAHRPLVDAWDAGPALGGTLSTMIGTAVEDVVTEVGLVVESVATMEAECRRRAEVCAQYSADLATFDAAWARYETRWAEFVTGGQHGAAPVVPSAPIRPASWVTASTGG